MAARAVVQLTSDCKGNDGRDSLRGREGADVYKGGRGRDTLQTLDGFATRSSRAATAATTYSVRTSSIRGAGTASTRTTRTFPSLNSEDFGLAGKGTGNLRCRSAVSLSRAWKN